MGERPNTPMTLPRVTQAQLAQIGQAIAQREKRCPWNPFPSNSPWGQAIDEAYDRDQRRLPSWDWQGRRVLKSMEGEDGRRS